MSESQAKQGCCARFGDRMKIRRNLSVSWLNVVSFFYSSMATVLLYVFMSAITGYVLTSIVPTPTDKQGAYAGDLLFVNEGVVLLTIHLWGFLSDLIGRRYVWALGFMFMAAGCTFYPFATSFEVLILIRVLYAIGARSVPAFCASHSLCTSHHPAPDHQ
jgi:MFS family permease